MSAERYYLAITEVLDRINTTQQQKLRDAGALLAESIASGGRAYLFGSGHSVIPVMDVFGGKDWEITQVGAYERKKQIDKVSGSEQVVVPDALHFFEGREDELVKIITGFLDRVFHQGNPASASSR